MFEFVQTGQTSYYSLSCVIHCRVKTDRYWNCSTKSHTLRTTVSIYQMLTETVLRLCLGTFSHVAQPNIAWEKESQSAFVCDTYALQTVALFAFQLFTQTVLAAVRSACICAGCFWEWTPAFRAQLLPALLVKPPFWPCFCYCSSSVCYHNRKLNNWAGCQAIYMCVYTKSANTVSWSWKPSTSNASFSQQPRLIPSFFMPAEACQQTADCKWLLS